MNTTRDLPKNLASSISSLREITLPWWCIR